MEKKASKDFCKAQKVLKRSLFIILLNCFILAVPFNAFAFESVFEQSYTLNLSFKNAKIEQILDAISKQSGIKIAYSTEELATDKNVSVNIQTSDIKRSIICCIGRRLYIQTN